MALYVWFKKSIPITIRLIVGRGGAKVQHIRKIAIMALPYPWIKIVVPTFPNDANTINWPVWS